MPKTYLAKAMEATQGQSPQSLRGLFDQAAKKVIAAREVLARIVKDCVAEAASYLVEELEDLIPGQVRISTTPIHRDDEEAAGRADPGAVHQDNTEDGTITEGTVRFDILFTLHLPGVEPILLIINVEIQNRQTLPYPLKSRAVDYACRLVSRQGVDYGNFSKVYSIWIVTDPQEDKLANTTETLVIAERKEDGSLQPASEDAGLFEVQLLYLGEPEENLGTSLHRMLDIIFTTQMGVEDKKKQLAALFDLQTTDEVSENMENILNTELALETRATARANALAEARAEKKSRENVQRMLEMGMQPDQIAHALAETEDYVKEIRDQMQPGEAS